MISITVLNYETQEVIDIYCSSVVPQIGVVWEQYIRRHGGFTGRYVDELPVIVKGRVKHVVHSIKQDDPEDMPVPDRNTSERVNVFLSNVVETFSKDWGVEE